MPRNQTALPVHTNQHFKTLVKRRQNMKMNVTGYGVCLQLHILYYLLLGNKNS